MNLDAISGDLENRGLVMSNITSTVANRIRVVPRATLMILAGAVIAILAVVLWARYYGRTAEAKEIPNAARIERVEGQVGLNRSTDGTVNAQWIEATANTPITVGDRVLTRDQSRTEIAFTGRNFATLEADTSMDVLDLTDQKSQVALRTGSALFDIGSLENGDVFEVATPCGAVDLEQPGMYQVSIDDQGNAVATTLNGAAQVVGQGGTGKINKGEVLHVPCQDGAVASLSQVDKQQAGAVVDGYYRHRYPRIYDGRYQDYDAYLADPNYFDPYRHDVSYQYVSDYIPGVEDLGDYGDWVSVADYGNCWSPRVAADWAPYQSGYWDTEYPYGETWISYEPWGYAPYHYGRWVHATNRWLWIPERGRTRPVYAPALVAFFSFGNDSIAWLPLGPGDPYVPRYYDRNWRARFVGREEFREHLFNQNVSGAITVVSARDFNRRIDSRMLQRTDTQAFAHTRPVSDPMSVAMMRRAALNTSEARRRFDVPAAMAQRINNTRVLAGSAFRPNLARTMRVESVPDGQRHQQMNLRDERSSGGNTSRVFSGNMATDQARERQIAELSARAGHGDRGARMQMRVLERQQHDARQAERINAAQQQSQQLMLHRQQQQQAESARRQSIINQQQQRVEAGRAPNRIRNMPPRYERHTPNLPQPPMHQPQPRVMRQPQPQPRVNVRPQPHLPQPQVHQPPPQARVMRQPQPQPRVNVRPQPPAVIRPPKPVQSQPQRMPPVQIRPPQPQVHIDRQPSHQPPRVRAGNPPQPQGQKPRKP
jgi:hypothetical protein